MYSYTEQNLYNCAHKSSVIQNGLFPSVVDNVTKSVNVFLEGDHPYESDYPYWAGDAWFPGDWVRPLLSIDED